MNKLILMASAASVALAASVGIAAARDQVKVVGSSTVFPYSQAAAEEFANKSGKPAPVVESTGTGGGFKAFCGGIGPDFADVTGASRAIKESEVKLCSDNGVTDILGIDGAGRLWYYAGRGGGVFAQRVQVGNGWGTYALSSGADVNRDGFGDLVGRDSAGGVWFYAGKPSGFQAKVRIASGW